MERPKRNREKFFLCVEWNNDEKNKSEKQARKRETELQYEQRREEERECARRKESTNKRTKTINVKFIYRGHAGSYLR